MTIQTDKPALSLVNHQTTSTRWLWVWTLILLAQISAKWCPMPDAVTYLSLAKNLAMGNGLINCGSPRWVASPGYPILISPFFWISQTPWLWLSVFQWSMMVAFMLGVYTWAKRIAPNAAVFIAGAAAIHASAWLYVRPTTTEASFITFVIWGINCLHSSLRPKNPKKSQAEPGEPGGRGGPGGPGETSTQYMSLIVGSLLLAYASFIRSAGLMVAAGAGIFFLLQWWQGKLAFKRALTMGCCIVLPSVLTVLGFYLREARVVEAMGGVTYANGFVPQSVSVWEMLLDGVRKRISDIGRLAVPGMGKVYSSQGLWLHASMAVYLPVFAGLAWAWWKLARKHLDIWLLALPFYLALHIGYARFHDGTRFLMPLLPVILLCVWLLLGDLKLFRIPGIVILCLLHISIAVGLGIRHMPKVDAVHQQWPDAKACAQQLQGKTGQVVGLGKINHFTLQLSILQDRQIPRRWTNEQVQEHHPRWVVTYASDKQIPGYHKFWNSPSGQFCIYERTEPVTSQPINHTD